jgi:hypothetical protein
MPTFQQKLDGVLSFSSNCTKSLNIICRLTVLKFYQNKTTFVIALKDELLSILINT